MVKKIIILAAHGLFCVSVLATNGCGFTSGESQDPGGTNLVLGESELTKSSSSVYSPCLAGEFDQEIDLLLSEHFDRRQKWDENKPESYGVFYVEAGFAPHNSDLASWRHYTADEIATNPIIDTYFDKIESWLTKTPCVFFEGVDHGPDVEVGYDYQDRYPKYIHQDDHRYYDDQFTIVLEVMQGADELEEIAALKELWLSKAIDHYSMSFMGDIYIEIENAEALASFYIDSGMDADFSTQLGDKAPSMESWYDMAIAKIEEGVIAIDVLADEKGALQSVFWVEPGNDFPVVKKIWLNNFTVLE